MATTFKADMLELAPSWLKGVNGSVFLNALGDCLDALLERTRESVRARLPSYSYEGTSDVAPKDALDAAAGERLLQRARYAATETDSAFATRIEAAWDDWKFAGSPYGVLKALNVHGYTGTRLITAAGKRYELSGDTVSVVTGTPWTFGTSGWNRFLIHIHTMPASWSGTPPASSSEEAQQMIRIIKLWKPAHAICDSIRITTGPAWGLVTWGSFSWGGGTSTTWTVGI